MLSVKSHVGDKKQTGKAGILSQRKVFELLQAGKEETKEKRDP